MLQLAITLLLEQEVWLFGQTSIDISSNVVAVGVPVRLLKSINEYTAKAMINGIVVNEEDNKKRKQLIISLLKL